MAGHGPLDRGQPAVLGTGILPDLLGDERQLARSAEAGGIELWSAEGEVGGVIGIRPRKSEGLSARNLLNQCFYDLITNLNIFLGANFTGLTHHMQILGSSML